jgi:16S rRNA (cytidine1402-2'-O)-methyltransferase
MSTLYLVGTPIGNLEDITYRAVRVLGEVSAVAAEDTRRAQVLFTRYNIHTPLMSYHEQGQQARTAGVLRRLAGGDVALISEAGMPAVSDPGFALVRAALAEGHRVEVVPGPSSVTAAVAASGIPSDRFLFLGFPPRTAAKRREFFREVASLPYAMVLLESPHRLSACLNDIQATLGDRRIAVCRELTKLHEEVFRGSVAGAVTHFNAPRGEVTLVVEGAQEADAAKATDKEVLEQLATLVRQGTSPRDAVTQVAHETGRPRRDVYRLQIAAGALPTRGTRRDRQIAPTTEA